MSRFFKSLLVSVALHLLVAAAFAVYFDCVPLPELPRLDLSAIELVLSDNESEAAAAPPRAEPEPPPPEPEPEPEPPPPEPEPEPPPPPPPPEPEPEPEPPPPEPEPEPPPPEPEPEPEPPPKAAESSERRLDEPPPPPEPPPPSEPPPEPAPAQARIDAPPSATKPIRPAYPTGARQRSEEGDVVLELSVSAQGRVSAASVFSSSGYPDLDAAALRAAKKARFVPARSGRGSVAATVRVTIEFRLSGR